MKFKVFFDSNQLFNRNGPLGEPFDNTIHDLHEFLEKNDVLDKVTICLPEVVVKERVQSKLEDIGDKIVNVNNRIRSLKSLGYNLKEVEPFSIDEHKEKLYNKVEEIIKRYSIQQVSNKEIDIDNLVDKSISKIKPFNDQGVGLKDTLIFLSIIDDAQADISADLYIFCSNNSKQFDDEVVNQFEQISGKKMVIVNNIESIKEKLDELIPLELHLEERNNKIRELIMKKLGTITKQINDISLPNNYDDDYMMYRRPFRNFTDVTITQRALGWDDTQDKNNEVISGYDYKDISLLNFEEALYGEFNVDAIVSTDIVYRDKNKKKKNDNNLNYDMTFREQMRVNNSMVVNWNEGNNLYNSSRYKPSTKDFRLTIRCNLETEKVSVSYAF